MADKLIPPLHLACSDDELRPALQYISIQQGIAYATNGHLVIVVNLHAHSLLTEEVVNALDGKFIHNEVWKKLIDATVIEVNEEGDMVYRKNLTVAKFEIEDDIEYPDIHSILKTAVTTALHKIGSTTLSPALLKTLGDVFQSKDQLTIQFRNEAKNLVIYPNDFAKQYALLMPIMTQTEIGFASDFDFNII